MKTVGIAATGLLAGCPGSTSSAESGDQETTATDTATEEPTATQEPTEVDAMTAVAAEWSVYRARLYDAVALGRAGAPAAGATVAQNVFARLEGAKGEYGAHERLESTSKSAYEGFESALSDYIEGLQSGGAEPAPFASATRTAQFAVVGASEAAPSGDAGGHHEGESETSLSGGPNVVEGVPEDADHVVEMTAVAFEPAELTVSVGDTVTFEHVGGEAHNVVAYSDKLPEGADTGPPGSSMASKPPAGVGRTVRAPSSRARATSTPSRRPVRTVTSVSPTRRPE